MKWKKAQRAAVTKFASVTLAACAGVGLLLHEALPSNAERAGALAAREQLKGVTDLSNAFETVADAMRPSVVNIRSVKRMAAPASLDVPPGAEESLRQFFGDDFLKRFHARPAPEDGLQQRGMGTGVIMSEDGYIITNAHVAREADELTVTLPNKKD